LCKSKHDATDSQINFINIKKKKIPYEHEKKYEVVDKRIIDEHYAWAIVCLAISKCPLGLIISFGENSLVTCLADRRAKRIIL